ncbi:M48 family metalloprotease [Sphingomonas rhizophila]|uniref:M48 family metalloprotease n=1 Tax=Sphingomonas rhizophila TaxID=2071607 RepID=A0A7G9SCD1_9SPHN|nr:M48 family metalloprotease [Sphingomonas rhizophila]QNN65506.1 M48 family metalloprotease [Sphingomonas rhizophila]
MRTPILLLAAASVLATGVAHAQSNALNQRDVAEAARQHPEVVQEFGGAETGPRAAYVERIGRKVAAYSGTTNASQVYRFTTLNSAVENAFAVPGGYVYITRQLMALMNDEAELAFVVGHETGHIAANHSRKRQQASTKNSVLGVLGVLLGSVVGGGFGDLIAQGAQYSSQLRTLGFSRDQEYQADQLGIRYITSAGYDPLASASMLSALGRASALEARVQGRDNRSTPEWASTHPLSQNRVTQASNVARQTGRAGNGLRNRDAFLSQLAGVYVDDDPAQGIIDGRSFTHPDLRLQFVVPTGYMMQNSTSAVAIEGSAGKAQFSGGRYTGDLQTYVQRVIYGLTKGRTQVQMSPLQRTTINGIPAAYSIGRAQTSSGMVDVSVMAYQWDRDTVYHFVTLTRGGQGLNPFASMVNSLRRITPTEAASIRPRIIRVHTVTRGDTIQSLANQMAYRDFKAERFVSLNGLAANAALVPGQKVKLVVYGARRT